MKNKRIKKDRNSSPPSNFYRNFYIIIGIFFIIVITKVIASSTFYQPLFIPDEVSYYQQAQHLFEGHMDLINPGYPIILSIAHIFSGDTSIVYHIMLFISAIVSTSIIFPAFFILRKYCNDTISIMGALAVTTLTFLNFYSFTLMTENLFAPLFLFSVWFLINSYGTDDKKWQIFASLSVVYLYITRSDGIAMLVGFITAFIYYVLLNRKTSTIIDLISKKAVLLGTFIVSLSSWIIVSHMANPSINYGSTYNVITISGHLSNSLLSIENLMIAVKLFAEESAYLFICSYFILTLVIFYYMVNYKKIKKDPLTISFLYAMVSVFILILAVVAFNFYSGEKFDLMGRYVEPIIPFIIILGIIYINDIKIIKRKSIHSLILFFMAILAVSLFIIEYNYTIILGFLESMENPMLYYLEPLYHVSYPEIFVTIYALAFLFLIYLSIKNKIYINALIIFIILSSLVPTLNLYHIEYNASNIWKDNAIDQYLNYHSNKNTILYIDTNINNQDIKMGTNVYGFWNKGMIEYAAGDSKYFTNSTNNTYLFSIRTLPYKEVASNNIYNLYQL